MLNILGHEKGFTVPQMQQGIFRALMGVDEISEMPLGSSVKAIKSFTRKSVTPIDSKEVSVNVRVIATTNRNMANEIKEEILEKIYITA